MTIPELHAALNDFPLVLLLASVVFDLFGTSGKNEGMVAAYFCVVSAAGSAILALVSGLLAERSIEQSPALHQLVENHETLGIGLTLTVVGLAAWRLWRRNRFTPPEQQSYIMIAVTASLAMIWLAHLGGNMVFDHGAGVVPR